ncbi:MAG: Gfo/Idh/MocA family oxidoreductase [Planctomycetes bacterium]|nr:Gfo/Idh/MocA family oxidoreductase [Planctomycetota bacterium]MBI5741728.1 Gfo/Idh/MocA family oxidoreductase [Nitrospirota bacterium]
MKKINIGVIGCANVAERCMLPAIKAANEFELIAVASRNREKAANLAAKFSCEAIEGYADILNRDDIDAVYVPLPTGLHEEWLIKALRKGKHVLSEKSLTTDYASAKKVIDEAEIRQLLVMEDFMFPYHRQHAFVKKLLLDGEIGDVYFFKSSFGFPPRGKDDIRYDRKLGGGALLDAGAYVVKATQMFLGRDLTLLGAFLKYDGRLDVDIYGGAMFTNNKDQISHVSFSFDNYYQCSYEIWGSKGKITADRAFTPPPNFAPTIVLEKQDHRQEFVIAPDNHFVNILKEFHRAIRENDFRRHWDEALTQAKLLDQIRENHARSD